MYVHYWPEHSVQWQKIRRNIYTIAPRGNMASIDNLPHELAGAPTSGQAGCIQSARPCRGSSCRLTTHPSARMIKHPAGHKITKRPPRRKHQSIGNGPSHISGLLRAAYCGQQEMLLPAPTTTALLTLPKCPSGSSQVEQ